jgi:hypothetical protein
MSGEVVTTKEIDYLDEDKPIRGQNYVLLSFVSPEDVILNKEAYYFSRFLQQFSKDMGTLFNGLLSKYPDAKDLVDTVKNNHLYISDPKEMDEQYRYFKSANSYEIESDYHRDNNFQTTIRGLKVRGVFDTLDEAKNRSEFLKKIDNKFDIFIGQVGCWCPWSPNPNDLQNQEYSETQLNTLMKKYKENMENKDIVFEQRKQEQIDIAKKNAAAATASNNTEAEVSELADALDRADPWLERKEAEATVVPPADNNEIEN